MKKEITIVTTNTVKLGEIDLPKGVYLFTSTTTPNIKILDIGANCHIDKYINADAIKKDIEHILANYIEKDTKSNKYIISNCIDINMIDLSCKDYNIWEIYSEEEVSYTVDNIKDAKIALKDIFSDNINYDNDCSDCH